MILIIVNIFYTSFLDDFSPSFAIAVYIRHIHHPGKYIWKLPGTAVFIYVFYAEVVSDFGGTTVSVIVYLLLIGRIMGRCVERAKWNGNSDNTVINQ